MPSTDDQTKMNHHFDWLGIVRTLLAQVLVLLALAGAFVSYLNWSSDAAWSEFVSANKPPVVSPIHQPQSQAPVQTVKGKAACARTAS